MSAVLGNQHARKANFRPWTDALRRALARTARLDPESGEMRNALDRTADKLMKKMEDELCQFSITEITSRLDGKAAQLVESKLDISGDLSFLALPELMQRAMMLHAQLARINADTAAALPVPRVIEGESAQVEPQSNQ